MLGPQEIYFRLTKNHENKKVNRTTPQAGKSAQQLSRSKPAIQNSEMKSLRSGEMY